MKKLGYQVCSIEITERCPLKCVGCYATKEGKDMSLEDFKTIIDKLPKTISSLDISGGEPFVNPNLFEIVKYTADNLSKPLIFTSGMFNDEKLIKKLKPFVHSFNVTIKYPHDEIDGLFKGNKKAYANANKFLKICNNLGIKTEIHWAADEGNFRLFDDMYEIAKKYDSKLFVLRFLPFNPDYKERYIDNKKWDNLVQYAVKQENVHIGSINKSTSYKVCTAGFTRLNVAVNGNVTPCIYYRWETCGNLITEDFEIIEKRLKDCRKQFKPDSDCLAKIKLGVA